MAYTDDYVKTNWVNKPATNTPINQTNLNHLEQGVKNNCGRVANLSTTKAEQSDLLSTFKGVAFDSTTGTFTFTKWDGTSVTVNTDLEKIAVNFDYDDDPTSAHYQNLVITLDDGTVKYVDMSALITEYEFTDTTTIAFTVGADGKVSANIPDGSITGNKLQPNYLADCQAAKTNAETAANSASQQALVSEGYAKGTQNGVPVTSGSPYFENNAEFFKNQASAIVGPKVTSFNGRNNIVLPAKGDYDADMIEFDPSTTSLPNTLETLQDFLEYAYPPSASVTLTLNGAKEDSITIFDSNDVQVGSCVFESGQTSGQAVITVPSGGGSYKFVSGVAKDIVSGTSDFEVTKVLTDQATQIVNVYPEHALYWYGNEIVAWVTSGYTNSGRNCYGGVKNTNDMYVAQTYDLSGIATYVGTDEAVNLSGYNTIKMSSKASAFATYSSALGINTTKDLGGGAYSYAIIQTGSDTSYHIGSADISNVSTSNYIFFAAGGNIRGGYSDAIWLE